MAASRTTRHTPEPIEPRPYQQRIVARALELFGAGGRRSVLVESPTGSGKTIMGLLIARGLQERLGVGVGWVAMRRYLLAQARAENEAKRIGVSCTYLSMFDRDPPTGLDLLVVDEAQHDAAGSMAHLHNRIRPRFILGLSATPFRTDRLKLCFDAVLRDAGIHRLIQDGYLSPFHHYTLPEYTPASVADAYAASPGRWGKTLVSFHTLAQCGVCRALLVARGVRAGVVSATGDRLAALAAFRAGRLDVLLNCQLLGEGFDCPELQTVFCRPACKGVTIQVCGRVLRRHAGLPYKQVVQCRQTPWPFTRTAGAALAYVAVGGAWRTLTANPEIDAVSWRVLRAISHTRVELPAFLTAPADSRRRRRRRPETTPRATDS